MEEILQLLREGKNEEEIAKIKQVSLSTIRKWIREIGSQKVEEARNEAKKRREEELLELIRQGKSVKEIAEIKQVSYDVIRKRIDKINSQKVEEARNEAKKRREEELLELIRQGKSVKEIAEIKQVSQPTIKKWINEIDSQKVEEARNEAKKRREEEILKLIKQGKTQEEIAEIKQVSLSTIRKWIREIDSQKVEEAKNEAKKRREEEILELKKQGKTQEEIAEIKRVSLSTIKKWIREINFQKVEEERNEVKLLSEREKPKENKQIKTNLYVRLKQKLKEHTITRDEIDEYKRYLDNKYDKIELKEVILISNMYIKTKRTSEAINFLNLLIGNEDMEYLGKEKLIEARDETERIGKIQRVRELVKNNRSISEIIADTGLKEIEVVEIRDQMQGDRAI